MTDATVKPWARHLARRALLQALYAWQMTDADVADLHEQISSTERFRKADDEFFLVCLRNIVRGVEDLDPLFTPYLDRAIDALDHVERAILRAGTYELKERLDVPVRVVINEWVKLAKEFGAEESFRYVNGVLDRVARDTRAQEMEAE